MVLSRQQFYHGSEHPYQSGDVIRPHHGREYYSDELGEEPPNVKVRRIFFTASKEQASRYGDVVPVRPTGKYHPHPWESGTLITASPLKVL